VEGASVDTQQLFQTIRQWVNEHYPAASKVRLVMSLPDGQQVRLPVQGGALPVATPANLAAAVPARPFEPNAFQLGILDALAGRALRVEKLVEAVKDRPRLYRDPGGLKELERNGLVKYAKTLGYYRPDAPPEELEE
jgi:hypothetical protein